MSQVQEILAEGRQKRELDRQIAKINRPSWRAVTNQVSWFFIGQIFVNEVTERYFHVQWLREVVSVAPLVFFCWLVATEFRRRDQIWRELIKRGAPELHERLEDERRTVRG